MNDSSQRSTGDEIVVAEKLSTGVEGLDSILNGGLPANHVYLVEGDPGTGKTTLALQFLREGEQRGEIGLYITLSETEEELKNIARSHGWSPDNFEIYELILASDNLKPESQYTIFYPSEIELNDTMSEVLAEVERIQPKRVVFDSLSEMRLLAQDPLRYRRQILALKQFFAVRDCTVLLLDDKTASSSSWQIHSIVHGVMSLEHLAVEYGAERRRFQVTKLRGSHFRGGYHDFNIETGGIKIFPRLIAAEHSKSFAAGVLKSGVKQLDALLGGGLDRGTSSLFTGPTGSGKSTLAAQFALSAAEDKQKSSIFVFDETRENYVKRATGVGLKIEQYLEENLITLQQVDPAELSPGEFAQIVIDSVKRLEARVVIIDSLNGYFNAMPEERFLKIQMHELLTYLN